MKSKIQKAICGIVAAGVFSARAELDAEVGEEIVFVTYTDAERGEILYQPTFEDRKGLIRTFDALEEPVGGVFQD